MKNEREKQEDMLNSQRAGKKLRELRLGESFRLREMARELEVDVSVLSRFEKGSIRDIRSMSRAYAEILIPDVSEQEKFINETRLLGGYAPENMTPDKATLITSVLSLIKEAGTHLETPTADFTEGHLQNPLHQGDMDQ